MGSIFVPNIISQFLEVRDVRVFDISCTSDKVISSPPVTLKITRVAPTMDSSNNGLYNADSSACWALSDPNPLPSGTLLHLDMKSGIDKVTKIEILDIQGRVIKYIDNDNIVWERQPLETLAIEGQLSTYHHNGFWQAMDTLRDNIMLNELWENSKAPWKVWE